MYNRILVPIAQNTNMSLVMGFVENVLNPGGEITLLYVIPSDKLPVSAVDWRQAMGVISEAQALSIARNMEVNYKVKNNPSVAQGILKEAASTAYDLILMSTPKEARRGRLFGGKIDEVVRKSAAETVVLSYLSDRPLSYDRILIPTSGYRHALRAAKIAEDLSRKHGSQITVMYVGSRKDEADAVINPLVSDIEANGGKARPLFESGPIADTILAEARKGYDIMMIGATERPAYQEFLLGSTADRLVRDAPCPVLMVKTAGKTY
jgi:nucleotide-binding universal stress UspA family protein